MDRIDLWLEVPQVEYNKLSDAAGQGEFSANIQKRIIKAREIQRKRFSGGVKHVHGERIMTNSEMGVKELKKFAPLSDNIKNILNQAAGRLDLSGRAYHKVIKIARTIADMEGEQNIAESHILEALQYRPK